MLNYGSPFHKVSGVLAMPHEGIDETSMQILVECWSDEACRLGLRCYAEGQVHELGEFATVPETWTSHTAPYSANGARRSAADLLPVGAAGIQGAGDIIITAFEMLNGAGVQSFTVAHGDAITFVIGFKIRKRNLRERAQVFIVISRNESERVCKFMTGDLLFDDTQMPEGVVEMHLPRMMLGAGHYSVAVEIAAEGYAGSGFAKFFSIDANVYHCMTHALEFSVMNSGWIGDGTLFEGEGTWRMRRAAG
jgi:Wzt C-terminal domain